MTNISLYRCSGRP